jgi:ABC-type multidrug transport system fused ATPase/permease subunit
MEELFKKSQALQKQSAELEEEYYKKILDIYQGIVGILFNVSMLFVLDRVLVWIVVITNVIPLFIPLITKNKLATLKNDTATKSTNFNKKLIDILEGISVAKSFKVQNLILGKMFKSLKELNSSTERYEKKDVSLNLLSGISFATDNFQNPATSALAFEMAGFLKSS